MDEKYSKVDCGGLTGSQIRHLDWAYIEFSDVKMSKIMENEIPQTIKYLQTRKALGLDQIPNEILKVITIEICSYL